MLRIILITLFAINLMNTSCKKDNKTPLIIPTTYDSVGYSANILVEQAVRKQINDLKIYMTKGRNVANKLELDSLNNYYTLGTPSLKSLTPNYYSNLIENTWFGNLVTSSQNTFDIATAPTNTTGGVFVDRLLDSKGKETTEEIEKGMFVATIYNYFVNLSQSTITETTVDRMLCIYGAHPNFPNTNTASKTTTPDALIAIYAARRDRVANNKGIYREIKTQFIKLKAAVKAGSAYNQEKQEAIGALKLLMEKAILSTVINYANSAKKKLDKPEPSSSDKAGAIHDLSECVGFVHGFKAVPQAHRKISDAQIDQLLTYFKTPANDSNRMYEFATAPADNISTLEDIKIYIKNIYNFTSSEMDGFNYNWITTENR